MTYHPFRKERNAMYTEKKYVKRPVIVSAYQTDKEVIIQTLEGNIKASIDDFIITGINGEQYPCKPDIFYRTYQEVISHDSSENLSMP